jgi:uncharacterized phage protein gp47/JayE
MAEPKLVVETPDTITARVLADMNAGVDPTDPFFTDVVGGGINNTLVRCVSLEQDRLYDRINSLVLLAIPTRAIGDFLDAWADAVGLERLDETKAAGVETFTGPEGTPIPTGAQLTTVAIDDDTEAIAFQTTAGGVIDVSGTLDLPIEALEAGSAGNVPANSVTLWPAGPGGVTVTNANRITGGSDVETDDHLAGRIKTKLSGTGGAGNVDFYANAALNYPGVGYVTVQANTPARGDVTILLTDVNNDPVPSSIIDGFKAKMDPYPGEVGGGDAPIGAAILVDTPAWTNVAADATITAAAGYTLDGTGGTRALRGPVVAALRAVVNTLPAGATVRHNRVLAAIMDVDGVVDVPALTLNGSAGDVAVDATHVATLVEPPVLT